MKRNIVISLYDNTGNMVRPWAEAGADCYIYDIQHNPERTTVIPVGHRGGTIRKIHADLYDSQVGSKIIADMIGKVMDGHRIVFGSAFPPCTDLSVAGARWWKRKEQADPMFQHKAAHHARMASVLFDCIKIGTGIAFPYIVENPVGALSRLWRKPDHKFDPVDYSGYLPEDDRHPRWPEYIPARDAYTKKTCLWTGGGFVMPDADRVVEPRHLIYTRSQKGKGTKFAPMAAKLGGTSQKTKDIRSETPRGFARACFLANQ